MNTCCTPYRDRAEAGRILGKKLAAYAGKSDTVVLGLARGGVPVALEVARSLRAPLDVFLVRKLGLPGQEQLAMGAIATGGACVLNDDVIRQAHVSQEQLEQAKTRETAELRRREERYRSGRPLRNLAGRTVLVVDDGLATGASLRAAVQALAAQHPARIVAAAPVGAPEAVDSLRPLADEIVCPLQPSPFHAVGIWYDHFDQVSDEEVCDCLDAAAEEAERPPSFRSPLFPES